MPSGNVRIQEMLDVLRQWQRIERQSMSDTAEIMEQTENPLIRMIMEIIRHDSLMHHRVQQFLVDTITKENVTITREDVAAIWERVEEHDELERQTIELATELREKSWTPVHEVLLDFLIVDEKKHDGLLGQLNKVKEGMSRASGA